MVVSMNVNKDIYTIEEACEYLRIGLSKMRELVDTGKITTLNYTTKTLFDYIDLRAFVESSKNKKV